MIEWALSNYKLENLKPEANLLKFKEIFINVQKVLLHFYFSQRTPTVYTWKQTGKFNK